MNTKQTEKTWVHIEKWNYLKINQTDDRNHKTTKETFWQNFAIVFWNITNQLRKELYTIKTLLKHLKKKPFVFVWKTYYHYLSKTTWTWRNEYKYLLKNYRVNDKG